MFSILERNLAKNIFIIYSSVIVRILRMNESFNRKRLEIRLRWIFDEHLYLRYRLKRKNKNREREEMIKVLKVNYEESEKKVLRG